MIRYKNTQKANLKQFWWSNCPGLGDFGFERKRSRLVLTENNRGWFRKKNNLGWFWQQKKLQVGFDKKESRLVCEVWSDCWFSQLSVAGSWTEETVWGESVILHKYFNDEKEIKKTDIYKRNRHLGKYFIWKRNRNVVPWNILRSVIGVSGKVWNWSPLGN